MLLGATTNIIKSRHKTELNNNKYILKQYKTPLHFKPILIHYNVCI